MLKFKEFIVEYELSGDEVSPSHVNEDDIDHSEFKKQEHGEVDGHRVVHYKSKTRSSSSYTFVTKDGETVGHIEHKPTKTAKGNRLAISNITNSNITKNRGSSVKMGNVLHHLLKHGHTLESDTTNTENGAHKMLMNFAKRDGVKTHIEHSKTGAVVPHEGDITSPENQKKYAVSHKEDRFLEDDSHKHILVFNHAS